MNAYCNPHIVDEYKEVTINGRLYFECKHCGFRLHNGPWIEAKMHLKLCLARSKQVLKARFIVDPTKGDFPVW